MDDPETQRLHARLVQLERDLIYRTTWLLAAIFLVLLVAVLLAVTS